jgi:cyclic beta-1,2-glucan synthetase
MLDKPGGIFVRRLEQIPNDDRVLLQSAARIVWTMKREPWRSNWNIEVFWSRRSRPDAHPLPVRRFSHAAAARELIFPNGLGGFTRDGHEYVITFSPAR